MTRATPRILTILLILALVLGMVPGMSLAQENVEEVTLSLVSYRAIQTEPCAWYETEVYQEILRRVEEESGYRISFDYSQYDEDKLNLMFASGDLPDIVYFYTATQAQTVLENGYAMDLSPLLEEYMPNANTEAYAQRNDLMRSLAGGEEMGLYFIPTTIGVELDKGGASSSRGYSLRWDWYKELGCPEITSDEDYANILAQIVANHPVTEEGKTVYAYGYSETFSSWCTRASFVKEAYVNPWTFSGYLYVEGFEDNVLYNGYLDDQHSAFWQEIRFANMLYKLGVFDIDSFTQTDAEVTSKIRAGQYVGASTSSTTLYLEDLKTNPDSLAGHIVVPSAAMLFFANKIHLAGYYPDQQVFVSSTSKNWKAALALIDYLHTSEANRMLFSGIEGIHWDYVDGVPTLREEVIANKAAANDEHKLSGVLCTTAIRILQPAELADDGYPVSLFETEENRASALNNYERDYSEYYGVKYPSLARQRLVDEGLMANHTHNFSQLVAVAREAMPTDISRILTKCNDICYRAIPKLVMAETEAEFLAIQQQVFADIEAAGEAEAWAWCSEAQAAAHALVDPIIWGE